MLKKLKQHWGVNNSDLLLILLTFTATGTSVAYASKKITGWLQISTYSFTWWVSKLIVLFFGYQFLILFFGFCFGQFAFFWKYEKKILIRLGLMKPRDQPLKNIAIFASGAGSNAQKIIDYFKKSSIAKVVVVICNKPGAGVLQIAQKENIPYLIIEKNKFYNSGYVDELKKFNIDLIVLAGFLWKIPFSLINNYPGKILNIHPALLPAFGGKGMYGSKVHEAVINAGEKQSGITIHFVDELYDHGNIIFQKKCEIEKNETPESLANKIHKLEHQHFPLVIEQVLKMPNQR